MERTTDPRRPADLPDWMGGPIPDGHTVPQPPQAAPQPLPRGYHPPRRGGLIATIAACTLIVVVLMVAGIAGVLAP